VEGGRFRDALERYRAGENAHRHQNPEAALLAATCAARIGEFRLAAELAESAEARFHAHADTDGLMRATNLLGAIAWEQGRLSEAETLFAGALELARTVGDSVIVAHATNNLASVAYIRNRLALTLPLYRSALLQYQRLGDRRGMAQTCSNLSAAFRSLQQWDDAEHAAMEAVRHAEMVGERSLLALAVMGRAEVRLERGELEVAEQELGWAERLCTEVLDQVGLAEVGRLRALLALRRGQTQAAADLATAARELAARYGSLQLQGECAGVAAVALHLLGRTEAARASRTEALRLFDRLGADRLREELDRRLGAWGSTPSPSRRTSSDS
jgi:tetratricopeptide (TPR) repeat protein